MRIELFRFHGDLFEKFDIVENRFGSQTQERRNSTHIQTLSIRLLELEKINYVSNKFIHGTSNCILFNVFSVSSKI